MLAILWYVASYSGHRFVWASPCYALEPFWWNGCHPSSSPKSKTCIKTCVHLFNWKGLILLKSWGAWGKSKPSKLARITSRKKWLQWTRCHSFSLEGNTLKTYINHISKLQCNFSCRLLVRQSGKLLHVVPRLHFVDSPEWFGVSEDDFFQVANISNWRQTCPNFHSAHTMIPI